MKVPVPLISHPLPVIVADRAACAALTFEIQVSCAQCRMRWMMVVGDRFAMSFVFSTRGSGPRRRVAEQYCPRCLGKIEYQRKPIA